MSLGASYSDNQPITWWKRYPIYAATILTGLLVVGMIVSLILSTAQLPLVYLAFSAPLFSRGALWQIFTFPFISLPSFFSLLGFCCFYSWSAEVEKFIGRARFFQLIGALILVEAMVCLFWWWVLNIPAGSAGSYHLTAALLIAFATLYPNIEYMFGWVPLKWFAFACLILGSLSYLPNHQWPELTMLFAVSGTAFGFIRWLQMGGGFSLPKVSLPSFGRKPKFRVVRESDDRPSILADEVDATTAEVDALLDKIAKSGIGSLTAKEKARLEKAREDLMRREPRR